MSSKTIRVPNISCGHCVMTIEREVGELDGVISVKANESTRQVTVDWNDSDTSWDAIEDLLVEINYPPASSS
jgi:copper chaperone